MKYILEKTIGPAYALLFGRPALYLLNKALFHLSLRGMGLFNCTKKTSGEEHFVRHVLPALLGDTASPVCFDVGANIGTYITYLSKVFSNATIYGFEPHPINFHQLKEGLPPSINLHNVALGSENGMITLYDRADNDGSTHASVYEAVITNWHKQKTTQHQVNIQTLDSFAEKQNINQIDFIKIDTEGHEYDVLAGAENLLKENRISIIQFEFGCLDCFSHHFLNDFRKQLPNHTLYRILPRHLLRLDMAPVEVELFGHQNIVAIKSSLLSRLR
jgi:FkbM family methyltransferase